jgi:quercetin dioxygenase-like cupin family protein
MDVELVEVPAGPGGARNLALPDGARHVGHLARPAGAVFGRHHHLAPATELVYALRGRCEVVVHRLDPDGLPGEVIFRGVLAPGFRFSCAPELIHCFRAVDPFEFLDVSTLPLDEKERLTFRHGAHDCPLEPR